MEFLFDRHIHVVVQGRPAGVRISGTLFLENIVFMARGTANKFPSWFFSIVLGAQLQPSKVVEKVYLATHKYTKLIGG